MLGIKRNLHDIDDLNNLDVYGIELLVKQWHAKNKLVKITNLLAANLGQA